MGLLLVVLLPLGFVVNSIFSNFYSSSLERNLGQLADRLAAMLSTGDQMAIGMISMMSEMNGVDVFVFDQNGAFLAGTDLNQPPVIQSLSGKELQRLSNNQMISKELTNEDDEPFLAIFRPIHSESLSGAIGILSPIQSAKDAIGQIQSLLILACIGAIFIAVGITYILSRRLSQPMLQMEDAARRMAKGDLDVKVEVLTDDETGSLARTLNELGEELKRYRDTRSEFFANISHELRTPITYLEGYSQVVADGLIESEEERNKYLRIIHQEARRMRDLVEDLFELSKMEEGQISVQKEWMDLSEALLRVIDRLGPKAFEKGLIIVQEIHAENPYVYGDGKRMEQIFFNLLDNAIKYTKQGTIHVHLYQSESDVIVEMGDTGVGIPTEELPFVFERFYRVEKSRSREYGGTGLGLAIVKRLVELQDGQIQITSELNRGTQVIVKFPHDPEEVVS